MTNLQDTVDKFLIEFPEYNSYYFEHLNDYGEILGHLFFGDCINIKLFNLLKENTQGTLIRKYITFIEEMFIYGNDAIQNIVYVTILEYLGDDEEVLKNAYSYFGNELITASKLIEKQIGRK
ncbi:hypothetical protein [Desulfosporosinus sp. SB140]|uniref:DUF7674 family protein n=1 Tax=Desulfosporosinus paludis TaxID=3115649 RepID=UPI00388F858D